MAKHRVNFRLDHETIDSLDGLAQKLDVSRTEVIRRAAAQHEMGYRVAHHDAEVFIAAISDGTSPDAVITALPYPGPAIGPAIIDGQPSEHIKALTRTDPREPEAVQFYIAPAQSFALGIGVMLYVGSLPEKKARQGVGLSIRVADLRPDLQAFGERPGLEPSSYEERIEETAERAIGEMTDDEKANLAAHFAGEVEESD